MTTEIHYPICDDYVEMEWSWDSEVECPQCGTVLAVDYDTDYDDNVYGPWYNGIVRHKEAYL